MPKCGDTGRETWTILLILRFSASRDELWGRQSCLQSAFEPAPSGRAIPTSRLQPRLAAPPCVEGALCHEGALSGYVLNKRKGAESRPLEEAVGDLVQRRARDLSVQGDPTMKITVPE